MMGAWTYRSGYPLLTVAFVGDPAEGRLTLMQVRWHYRALWLCPDCVYAGGPAEGGLTLTQVRGRPMQT